MRNNTTPFRGKTVVIVGGSKGIGKATACEEEEKTKFAELKVLTAKAKLLQPEDVAQALVRGLQHKRMNIHVGSSEWISWMKRYLPWARVLAA